MTTDVNVTKKVVARALWEHDQKRPTPPFPTGDPEVDDPYLCRADDALSALADPDVLAGIAGVLRGYWPESGGQAAYEAAERERIAASAAVVELLRGERA